MSLHTPNCPLNYVCIFHLHLCKCTVEAYRFQTTRFDHTISTVADENLNKIILHKFSYHFIWLLSIISIKLMCAIVREFQLLCSSAAIAVVPYVRTIKYVQQQ